MEIEEDLHMHANMKRENVAGRRHPVTNLYSSAIKAYISDTRIRFTDYMTSVHSSLFALLTKINEGIRECLQDFGDIHQKSRRKRQWQKLPRRQILTNEDKPTTTGYYLGHGDKPKSTVSLSHL